MKLLSRSARTLALLLALAMLVSTAALAAEDTGAPDNAGTDAAQVQAQAPAEPSAPKYEDFLDVQGHWAEPYLRRAVSEGLLNGTSATTLDPNGKASLPQLLAILNRMLSPTGAAESPDLAQYQGQWFVEDVDRALTMGLDFSMERLDQGRLTRGQAFTLIAQAFRLVPAEPDHSKIADYYDYDELSPAEQDAAAALANLGYIQGSFGYLLGHNAINRAELITILLRIVSNTVSGDALPAAVTGGTLITGKGDLSGRTFTDPVWLACDTESVDLSGVKAGTVTVLSQVSDLKLDRETVIDRLVLAGGTSDSILFLSGRIGTLVVADGAPATVQVNRGVGSLEVTGHGAQIQVSTSLDSLTVAGEDNTVTVTGGRTVKTVRLAPNGARNTVTLSNSADEVNLLGTENRVDSSFSAKRVLLGGRDCVLGGWAHVDELTVLSRNSRRTIQADEIIDKTPEGAGDVLMELDVPQYFKAGDRITGTATLTSTEEMDVKVTVYQGDLELRSETVSVGPDPVTFKVDEALNYTQYMPTIQLIQLVVSPVDQAPTPENSVSGEAVIYLDNFQELLSGIAVTLKDNGSVHGGHVRVTGTVTCPVSFPEATLTWTVNGVVEKVQTVALSPQGVSVDLDISPSRPGAHGECAVNASVSLTVEDTPFLSAPGKVDVVAGISYEEALATVTHRYAGDRTLEWALANDYSAPMKTAFVNAKGYKSETEYLIWVNLTYQRVNVFKGSQGNWTLEKVFLCGTGASGTPVGEYRVFGKQELGWRHSSYWCEPVVRFYEGTGYAFHSRLWYPGHKELKDARIGFPISAGCVRMYDEDVWWIFNNIPLWTKVVVH